MTARKVMGSFEYNSPSVVAEKFQEGLIVLNLETGKYFEIGERLVPLLDALVSGADIGALKSGLDALEDGSAADADKAIGFMLEQDLLRARTPDDTQIDPQVFVGILRAGAGFLIDEHDDLAELMAADPIHDIDPNTGRMAL